ncbi:unnamed protein product [Choristocarpus tenellus]
MLRKYCDVKVITEGLKATYQRMMKHVSREGNLLGPLWDKLSDTLFAIFSRYEELCLLCFQHTLVPSASDVKHAANEICAGSSVGSPSVPEGQDSPSSVGTPLSGGGSYSHPSSSPGQAFGGEHKGFGQTNAILSQLPGGGSSSSPQGGPSLGSPGRIGSPVNRGKAFISRRLRLG